MTDLPEIYAICSNRVCSHVWTEPPSKPCPSCGSDLTPTLVDTQDGRHGIDLEAAAKAAGKTGASMKSMMKEIEAVDKEMRKIRRERLRKGPIEHGVTKCPECAKGKLHEYPGQEEKQKDVLMVCDSPDHVCTFRLTVDRIDADDMIDALDGLWFEEDDFPDHSDPRERNA